jgi:hypothetical protein
LHFFIMKKFLKHISTFEMKHSEIYGNMVHTTNHEQSCRPLAIIVFIMGLSHQRKGVRRCRGNYVNYVNYGDHNQHHVLKLF